MPSRALTYGLGRVEDLAGAAIVVIILFNAIVAGYEAVDRLIHPQPLTLVWVVAIMGFVRDRYPAKDVDSPPNLFGRP